MSILDQAGDFEIREELRTDSQTDTLLLLVFLSLSAILPNDFEGESGIS